METPQQYKIAYTETAIQDMEERGVPVHTNTLQARDFLKGRT